MAGILSMPVGALIAWLLWKRRRRPTPEDKDSLKQLYFETGLQYYIAARYSAIAGLIPISGNLFHHAFEMFIKGHLTQDLDEWERVRLGHSLKHLWKRYKKVIGDPALDGFDAVIKSLDRFEDIRYPEPVARRGMTGSIDFVSPTRAAVTTSGSRQPPAYDLNVADLDALRKLIFAKSLVNVVAFTGGLNRDALEYLNR
jgi:hypothetical protein